jgi:hypothetical protein
MKIRSGFVSNSSSSSFVIPLEFLSALQYKAIVGDREKIAKRLIREGKLDENFFLGNDLWSISEDATWLRGDTCMDNFDMRAYLAALGVDEQLVSWED